MLKPLEQFYCDTCGELINTVEEGYVEWLSSTDYSSRQITNQEFSIIHNKRECSSRNRNDSQQSASLKDFTKEKGLVNLLSKIDCGPIHNPNFNGPNISEFRIYLEFMRRLTLPYYEEARKYWTEAVGDGYFNDMNEIKIYLPDTLKGLIEKYS